MIKNLSWFKNRRGLNYRKMDQELLPPLDQCSSCGMCAGICPYIGYAADRVRPIYACPLRQEGATPSQRKDSPSVENALGCSSISGGYCRQVCPQTAHDGKKLAAMVFGRRAPDPDFGHYQQIYFARANPAIRPQGAQYGGVVSALAQWTLEQERSQGVIAVSNVFPYPSPYLATNSQELANCAGSRYLAVPSLAARLQAKQQHLDSLTIIGRPCQVTAWRRLEVLNNTIEAKSYLDSPKAALIIGLFCFWALDSAFYPWLKGRIGTLPHWMDIGPQEVILKTDQGEKQVPVDEIRPFIRPACLSCPDPTSELADVAVGSTELDPQWNTLVIRSDRGCKLVGAAQEAGWLELKPYPAERLPILRQAVHNKKLRVIKAKEAVNQ